MKRLSDIDSEYAKAVRLLEDEIININELFFPVIESYEDYILSVEVEFNYDVIIDDEDELDLFINDLQELKRVINNFSYQNYTAKLER